MAITALTLTNPGAEAGDTSGWTVRGGSGFAAVTAQGGVTPHSGSYFFKAGASATAVWDQQVAIPIGLEAAVDAGTAEVLAAAWHSSFSDADSGALYVEAYDSGPALLARFENNQSDPSSWSQESACLVLPALTRFIRIGTSNFRDAGTNLDAYWDDFTLDISDDYQVDYPVDIKNSQEAVYVWGSEPADELRDSQEAVVAWAAAEESSGLFKLKTHQVAVYAWVKGYVEQPHVRAWTYSLDGHDFYVLRLATLWTVCLDLTTGQWSEWFGHNLPYWRAHTGMNWLGMGADTALRLYGTNVVAGDDRAGILWMLDPTTGIDDGTTAESDPVEFNRSVTGLVQQRMRASTPCGGVYLTVSLGQPIVAGAAITLDYSDDGGNSYVTAGSVTVDSSDFNQEIAFRSLGLIRAPGRVFRITDNGASVRINAADMK